MKKDIKIVIETIDDSGVRFHSNYLTNSTHNYQQFNQLFTQHTDIFFLSFNPLINQKYLVEERQKMKLNYE